MTGMDRKRPGKWTCAGGKVEISWAGPTGPPSPLPGPGWLKSPGSGNVIAMMGTVGGMYHMSGGQRGGIFYMLNMDTHGDTHTCTHTHTHRGPWQDATNRQLPILQMGTLRPNREATTYPKAEQQSQGHKSPDGLTTDALPQGLDRSRTAAGTVATRGADAAAQRSSRALTLFDPSQGTPLPPRELRVPAWEESRGRVEMLRTNRGGALGPLLWQGPGPPASGL